MDDKTLREKTSDTILETPRRVTMGGREFDVAPPTCATLIAVSRLVPQVPYVELLGNRIKETLAMAKDSDALFLQVATMIKGTKKTPRGMFKKKEETIEDLAEWLKNNCSPKEINDVRKTLFGMMEVDDFFEFTAFLQETSLIQKTRGAVAKTTIPFGQ